MSKSVKIIESVSISYEGTNVMKNDLKLLSNRAEQFYTNLLALRPVCLADSWALWDATRDPAFNENLLWRQPTTPPEVFQRIESILQVVAKNKMGALSVVCPRTGEWIGLMRFFPTRLPNRETGLELGVWAHPKYWSSEVTRSLVIMATEILVTEGSYRMAIIRNAAANPKARAICLKLGYSKVGISVAECEDGTPMPIELWKVTADEWTMSLGLSHLTNAETKAEAELLAA
jgi:RimJ/RimL family protein N-acetyltransferase